MNGVKTEHEQSSLHKTWESLPSLPVGWSLACIITKTLLGKSIVPCTEQSSDVGEIHIMQTPVDFVTRGPF